MCYDIVFNKIEYKEVDVFGQYLMDIMRNIFYYGFFILTGFYYYGVHIYYRETKNNDYK